MVSHSSSASLSSLSLSRTSHTSASSLSSPPSSPDSATNASLSTQNHSASPHRTSSVVVVVTPSIIPFSWEETPGVLKKETMQTSHLAEHGGDPPFFHRDVDELYARAYTAAGENLQPLNNCKHTRRCASQGPRTACTGEGLPRIRLPPCLSHPEQHASMVEGRELTTLQRPHPNHHHHHHHHHPGTGASAAAVGSKIMSSLSLHKRRHHRSTPSLDDDPFWLAMVACTNDAHEGVPVLRKGPKAFFPHEKTARRVQESIHLDQRIPRQSSLQNRTISRNFHSGGGQAKAFNQARYDDEEASNSVNFSPSKVHNARTDIDVCHLDVEENESIHSDGLACKAFKALSLARTELHDRCKALRQQQGPPIVDISCTSRHRKSKVSGIAAKHKLPDAFGCKSNHPLIVSSRFS